MTDKQPEALRLADACQGIGECDDWPQLLDAASELRRLHAENALLHYTLTAYVGASEALAVEQTENELLERQRDELLEALRMNAQALAWLANGKCRGFHPKLPTVNVALDAARAAIEAVEKQQ